MILSELQILHEMHDQLASLGSHENFFVRTEFFPFLFENLAHSTPRTGFFELLRSVSCQGFYHT